MSVPFNHLCLLGGSGSGKTTFASNISLHWKNTQPNIKSLYITNVNDIDKDVPKHFTYLSIDSIFNDKNRDTLIKNCVLIIEDLINIPKPLERALLYILNYSARRNNIIVIANTHSFKRNNLLQIVQHIGVIIIFGRSMAACESFKVSIRLLYVYLIHKMYCLVVLLTSQC